ncbi:MFS transporter [Streptomyces avermitilis]|uniref:MFS transporter n=1 Tax=Streptomyces avermitilis TaxID=33903 RepID=UPI0037F30A34
MNRSRLTDKATSPSQQRLILTGSITGAVVVAVDGTALTIMQPVMQRDLGASLVQIQWTSSGYLIAVASLLVFAGRLGDRYGHQRLFATGVLGFAAASVTIGLTSGIVWVIILRIAQGVFGALLQPATLGMLRSAYPPDRLGRIIAVRTGAIGVATAAGPLVGGALAAELGWRTVFFLSAVPALAVGVAALAVRAPGGVDPSQVPAGLDVTGAILLATGLGCLVHTLVGIPENGWAASTLMGLAAAAVVASAFVWHQRRAANPLVPGSLARSTPVTSGLGVLTMASAAMFGALFVGTYFLQDVLVLDPFQSSLQALPGPVGMVLGASASAPLARHQGPRRTAVAAMVLVTAGILLMSGLDEASSAMAIGLCFLVLGAGFGMVLAAGTAVIVRASSTTAAGVTGGLQQTAMNVGPALGVAAATTLLGPGATVVTSKMGPALLALAGVAAMGALWATRFPSQAVGSTRG